MDKCSSLLRPQFCPQTNYICIAHEDYIDCHAPPPPPPDPCQEDSCPDGTICQNKGTGHICKPIKNVCNLQPWKCNGQL